MGHKFEGLILFIIGLSNLLTAFTIDQIQPTGVGAFLWLLGCVTILAGIIWAIIGGKFRWRK